VIYIGMLLLGAVAGAVACMMPDTAWLEILRVRRNIWYVTLMRTGPTGVLPDGYHGPYATMAKALVAARVLYPGANVAKVEGERYGT